MNVELLRKVKQHILEEPRRFDMRIGASSCSREVSPCGTVGCIAGWAGLLSGKITKEQLEGWGIELPWGGVRAIGLESLGLDNNGKCILFQLEFWPYSFRRRYEDATTKEERASIAADRIEHYITTKGRE